MNRTRSNHRMYDIYFGLKARKVEEEIENSVDETGSVKASNDSCTKEVCTEADVGDRPIVVNKYRMP